MLSTCPTQPIKRPLSSTELDYLSGLSDGNRLLALFRCLCGAEAFDTAPTVDPTRISIPQAQWAQLADSMTWVNIGPSSYHPEGGAK